tara:strand:- start:423 stop:1331 length:909 start_codon:yes stop_codon:yes gene_type:complete
MELLDFKILIIFLLAVVIYFLYKDLEDVKNKMYKISKNLNKITYNKSESEVFQIDLHKKSNQQQNIIKNKKENNIKVEIDSNEENMDDNKQMNYSEENDSNEEMNDQEMDDDEIDDPEMNDIEIDDKTNLLIKQNEENIKDEEIISLKINDDEDDNQEKVSNNSLEINEKINDENNHSNNQENSLNEEKLDSQEMLSNMSENYETYSNDDIDENLIQDVNLKKKNKMVANEGTNNRIDNNTVDIRKDLLKNKLPELQDLANTLKINTLKVIDGKNKKKTKLELANDIIEIKYSKNIENKYLN